MGALSLHFPSYKTHPEDRRFKWIVVLSVILHSLILLEPKQAVQMTTTQAPHRGIDVSLSLLQQQLVKQQTIKNAPQPAEHQPRLQEQKLTQAERRQTESKLVSKAPVRQDVIQPVNLMAMAPQLAEQSTRGLEQEKTVTVNERYLAKLLTHIESFKYYPRMAQRRGIEGEVTVTFRLLPHGEVDDLSVTGPHMLLEKAAQSAVQQAMPMLPAPAEVGLPLQISFVMQFQLPGHKSIHL